MKASFKWLPLAVALLIGTGLYANAEETIPGRPLLSGPIDSRDLVTLEGNTRPEATAVNDRGVMDPSTPLEHVLLQLRRSPAQEAVVEDYIDTLTAHGSPNFHHWMTPAEFGGRFGVADADIAKIEGWLKSNGLHVDFVYPSRMMLGFSGTVGQIGQAFRTSIHRLEVDGVAHFANMNDPKIPAALAPAIEGIASLNDFHLHNKIRRPTGVRPKDTGDCSGGTCNYDLAPGDLATIYDLKALFAAGYSGQGEVIAAVEPTNLYSNGDWTTFRSVFGLNKYTAGKLVVSHPGPPGGAACGNPGVSSGPNGDDGEAALDVEWASAAAPSATILLASCNNNNGPGDGLLYAIENLTNGKAPPAVISVSYGTCEADNGAASNAAYNKAYQQAVAQGITIFVATGDDGPTDCASNSNGTAYGIGINAQADTQYNVAVGGTDFSDTYSGTSATYWTGNTGAPWATAKSYVPEIPWNDTCASVLQAAYANYTVTYGASGYCNSKGAPVGLGGGEGGPSGCYSGAPSIANVVSGTCKGYPKPAWQKLVGVPADGVRDVPDIAMFASSGGWNHNLDTCFTDPTNGGGPCTGNPVDWAANAGGTSYATPIMSGIQALVDQYIGGRVGNASPIYYELARAQYGAAGNAACSASKGNAVAAGCIFHDVVLGDDDADCTGPHNCYRPSGTYGVLSTSNTAYKPAYKATVGYDFPTGIGTVNAFNLAKNWPKN